jgi:hypothetical protein
MSGSDIIEILIFVVVTAIHAGIVWSKLSDHNERIKALEGRQSMLSDNHQKIELNIVNVPTKQDMNQLSSEIQGLKISLAKLETILNIMAQRQQQSGYTGKNKASDHD